MHLIIRNALLKQRLAARLLAGLVVSLGLVLAAPQGAMAVDQVYTGWLSNVAVDGYDAVAFFTEGRPVEGSREFTMEWRGAEWRFATREHLEMFRENPERYAPQYGGHCAWAMASGDAVSGDPRYWRIVDGKLYLNYDADVQQKWEEDIPGFIERADPEWQRLLSE